MYSKVTRVSNVNPNLTDRFPKPFDSKNTLFNSIAKRPNTSGSKNASVLAYYANEQIIYTSSFSFGEAFLKAYNTHRDIGLSPDDVWFQILSWFAKYIDSNAEALRDKFVKHQDKKILSVTTSSDVDEEKWEEFFDLMHEAIRDSTKPGVVDVLESKFSTTGIIESILSTGTIMSGFAKYFNYERCIPMCGIRNVIFFGTLEDWIELKSKLEKLKQFILTPDDPLDIYIKELIPILEKFISTYLGNSEEEFWDKIFNLRDGSFGSGSTTFSSGWILKFYGIYNEIELADLENPYIKVDIKIDNKKTGIKKIVQLYGGFGGISRISDDKYDMFKPQQSFIIYHDGINF